MKALTSAALRTYKSSYESVFDTESDYDYDLFRYVSFFYTGNHVSPKELNEFFYEWESSKNFMNKERMFLETFNSLVSKSYPDVIFTTPDEVWKELADYARRTFVGGDNFKDLMDFLCVNHKVEARNLPTAEDIGTAYVLANRDYGLAFAGLINRIKSGNPMTCVEIESGYGLDYSVLCLFPDELELPDIICKSYVPKEMRNTPDCYIMRPKNKLKPPFNKIELHSIYREFMELYSYEHYKSIREKDCQLKFINWLLERYCIPPITSLPSREELPGIDVKEREMDYTVTHDYYSSKWERFLFYNGWRYFISPSDEYRIGSRITKTRKIYYFNGREIDESVYNSIKNPYSGLTDKDFCAKVVSELFDKNYNKQEEPDDSKPPVPFPKELF